MQPDPGKFKPKIGWRWFICALLFFATAINYMDRQILGLLAPTLENEIGWTEKQFAHIVVAFQFAYAVGLAGFGRWIDHIGSKAGYAVAVSLWSLAAVGHAFARNVFGFGVARFALGLGEAGNFPAAVKTVAEWFPCRERALANGLFNSGCNVGAVLAPLVVPWMALHWGWRSAFIALGAAGFVWLAFWLVIYSSPEKSSRVSPEELAFIESNSPEPLAQKISWLKLLSHRQTWAFIVGYAFSAPIWWFYLYWLPKFLNRQYGLNLTALGLPLVVIYSMTCFGSIGGGWLSSVLMRRGHSVNAARKTAMLICAILVLPVVFAAHASNVWLASVLIGLAASAHQGWAANLFAIASDLFPKQAIASVVGIGGMAGALTAMGFAESTGYILEKTGSYWILFSLAPVAYLMALALIQLLSPRLSPVTRID